MIMDVREVTQLHRQMVIRWHRRELDNPYDGFLAVVCQQHSFNFLLWHQEDIARSPDAADSRIAEVKRTIDKLNQQRNDWIERIDDWISEQLEAEEIQAAAKARLNTETPGSATDRLSILALRSYHYEEQVQRRDADPQHLASVKSRLALCLVQHADLSRSLTELMRDICAGRVRHKTYRQMKMYNDPSLNPYLYQARGRRAG